MQNSPLLEYGKILQEGRELAGYTQDQVCEMIGVSKTSLRNWEKGRKSPSEENIEKLRKLYQVPLQSQYSVERLINLSKKELVDTICDLLDEK